MHIKTVLILIDSSISGMVESSYKIMPKKQIQKTDWLRASAIRITRVHFLYIAAYMISIVVFDSWNLITHESVASRWTAAVIMLVLNTVLWYLARMKYSNNNIYILIVITLVLADIIFAAFNVYWQRGIASKAVAMFAVPIVTAAALRSRSTILAAFALSAAAYSLAAVKYFYEHYGESFKVELYGELFFFGAVFLILAGLLMIIINPRIDA